MTLVSEIGVVIAVVLALFRHGIGLQVEIFGLLALGVQGALLLVGAQLALGGEGLAALGLPRLELGLLVLVEDDAWSHLLN